MGRAGGGGGPGAWNRIDSDWGPREQIIACRARSAYTFLIGGLGGHCGTFERCKGHVACPLLRMLTHAEERHL